ncbi:metal dependent phosphohydrolase [Leptotrichia shahii]|jgi:hydrolase, HD family|uniref:bis(5'-nucleosyl)-tetraphosphatase (symmetrical) n=2 Tax=Leptotrichia shahii TaxID=157691 RepID=A0A510JLD5_9FUSO|nr:bis(5'-nucleosyl)-tetraphosphatase (symmetrical) YqeK [Leptotrichia shahii]BBM39986.1 metal dependent phosphohydrolase [Leptotrichia shahii]
MNMEVIKLNVKKFLDEKRYEHVKRVTKCAVEMAKIYGVPVEKVEASAWLHDVAKFFDLSVMIDLTKGKYPEVADKMSQSTAVLHGFAGAEFVRQNYELFGIDDEEILDGIKYHTIGCENMNTLAKIVYLADAIEEKRSWEGVEKARELAKTDLDEAIKFEIEEKLKYLLAKDSIIHPNVIKFRNSIIANKI